MWMVFFFVARRLGPGMAEYGGGGSSSTMLFDDTDAWSDAWSDA